MKRFLIAAAAVAVTGVFCGARAEGYQVNSLSAKQIGMAHTGIALHLGAESNFFNPAGLGFMDESFELTGSFTAVQAKATAHLPNGTSYQTDNNPATPIGIHSAFSIYDNLKAGISFYTPYGNGCNWGLNWPGAMLNQKVSLKVFTVQPTVSYKILPNLSVGAGLMISWASVDLTKGLVPHESFNVMAKMMGVEPCPTDVSPASVNISGKSEMVLGYNVGAMWDINKDWTVGANFRSKQMLKLKAGDAHVLYNYPPAEQMLGKTIGVLNNANFKAEMPCPWVLGFGAAYKGIKNLTLAFDARLTGWGTYKTLDLEFANLAPFDQHITKDYKNSWAFSLGAEYAVTKRLDARAGFMIDTPPANKDYYNPETPSMLKLEPCVGISFRPIPSLSIDASFMYVASPGIKNCTCPYDDFIAKSMIAQNPQAAAMVGEPVKYFSANYNLHAFVPSIGLTYKF